VEEVPKGWVCFLAAVHAEFKEAKHTVKAMRVPVPQGVEMQNMFEALKMDGCIKMSEGDNDGGKVGAESPE
jgi:hypothetical protein